MSDLRAFLNARLDEAEAREACKYRTKPDVHLYSTAPFGRGSDDGHVEVQRFYDSPWERMTAEEYTAEFLEPSPDPFALADIAAKRRILRTWPDTMGQWTADQADAARLMKEHVLRSLAAPYADHPDYQHGWNLSALV